MIESTRAQSVEGYRPRDPRRRLREARRRALPRVWRPRGRVHSSRVRSGRERRAASQERAWGPSWTSRCPHRVLESPSNVAHASPRLGPRQRVGYRTWVVTHRGMPLVFPIGRPSGGRPRRSAARTRQGPAACRHEGTRDRARTRPVFGVRPKTGRTRRTNHGATRGATQMLGRRPLGE